jgi:hypothetical protein
MSSFILAKMYVLIESRVQIDNGFKEIHLTTVAKALMKHRSVDVSFRQTT